MVSFGSLVAFEIRFPISCTVSMASSFHVPGVSIAIGANTCVEVMAVYFVRLISAAQFAAAPARRDVSLRWYSATVSGTVAFQSNGLPQDHGISVAPPDPLLSNRLALW